jgi:fluoride exporter
MKDYMASVVERFSNVRTVDILTARSIGVLNTLLIFFGAGAGGVFRYWISNAGYWFLGRQFPYGTLIVNVSGCFLMGLFFVLILERFDRMGPQLRSVLLIGFLGGYTTFSSFSIETLNLFENGAYLTATLNVVLSVTLCIAATWLGVMGGRQL